MSTIVHEREGVLFLNADGTWSGRAMFGNVVYELTGIQGTGRQTGKTYIQISAREHSSPAAVNQSMPASLPSRSPRTHKLAAAMREVERKYGSGK